MALVFESASTVQGNQDGAAVSIATPAGVASGDALVFSCVSSDVWTYIEYQGFTAEIDEAAATAADWLASFWKVATGSEGATIDFDRNGGTEYNAGGMLRFSGAHATAPVGAVSAITQGTATGPQTLTSPAVTATADGSIIVRVWAFEGSSAGEIGGVTIDAGPTERVRTTGGSRDIIITTETGPGNGVTSGTHDATYAWGTGPYSLWTFEVVPAAAADTTAATYSVPPAEDSVTTTTITVDATASDETSATVNHYAVAVADAATAPSAAQVKAGQDSTGSAAIAAGSDLGVTGGVEGSITLTGLTPNTPYDVYYAVEDTSGNLTTVTKIDSTTAAPPVYSVNPAVDTKTATSITVDATAADAVDASVNHYAVAVANGAAAPSEAQIAAGQDSTGSAAISAGSDLAVLNGVEGSIVLSGLTASVDYDIYYTVGDSVPNYAPAQKLDSKTKPAVSTATIAADGVTVTLVFTEAMTFATGGSGGFAFATPTATLAYSSGDGTNTVVFTASATILSTDTPTLGYTQPNDGWQSDVGARWLDSFTGKAVNNNSTQSGAGEPAATAQQASGIPGAVITFALTNFTNAPNGATLNGVAVAVSNATTASVDVTLPALTTFVEGGTHETTEWGVDQTVQITDSVSADTASDTIQIDPPGVSGPTYWYGTAVTPAGDSVFPVGTVAGDEYLVEETAGTVSNVSTAGSVEATTADYSVAARIWDESANAGAGGWSAVLATDFDGTAPSGYLVGIDQADINSGNETALSFTFADAEVGADYDYSISSSGGGTPVTGNGTIATATDQITGINVSTLPDGTLTLSVTLTDAVGNEGAAATDQVGKSTSGAVPSGYSVSIDQASITVVNEDALSFTFAAAESGTTYDYSITSSGGAGEVTGSGLISSATQQVIGIDVTSLPDGTLTLSVTLTNGSGAGAPATDVVGKDTTAPSGYTATIDQAGITPANETALSFTLGSAEVGTTYNYSISSSGGGTPVTGSGTVVTGSDQVAGINVSALPDGTLTLSVTLTDASNNTGAAATDTVSKDTGAPTGYSVTIDQAVINAANDNALSFTFAGAEVGADYAYSITSSGGAGEVSDTGTISTATDQISAIDVTSLPDGTLTLVVTLTDTLGNEGSPVQDVVTKDATAPAGYTVAIDADIDETNHTALSFTFTAAEVGTTYEYTVSSSGGGTPVTDTGAVTAANQQVTGIDVSTLPDGTLTLSVTLTDAAGNEGSAAQDTASKDTTDLAPDIFDLGARGSVEPSTAAVESDLITVSGLGTSVDVTLSGDSSAEYQKNGGLWATAATTAVDTDTFKVRVDASSQYNATTFATLTIGELADTFTVRTKKDPALAVVEAAPITRLHSRR